MSAIAAPERSLDQRMRSLALANKIRVDRGALKREVAAGRQPVAMLIGNPPPCLLTMRLYDLLLAQRKWGRMKVGKTLALLRISTVKTVGGLSVRQRREIIQHLGGSR